MAEEEPAPPPFLAARRERVERALLRALEGLGDAVPAPQLEVARYGALSGGKRLRPILLVTAYEETGGQADARGGVPRAIYDLGASVELIHASSLMHDDLPCLDDAPLRRGRPTPHSVFGVRESTVAGAVLVGCGILWAFQSAKRIAPVDRARRIALLLARATGAGAMVGGQYLDLEGEGKELGWDELKDLHLRKTGALLAESLTMGAVAADRERHVGAMRHFGESLGLAFQLRDDVLDATQSAAALGKVPSDSGLEKSTAVRLMGVDAARRRADEMIRSSCRFLDETGLEAAKLKMLARYIIDRRR